MKHCFTFTFDSGRFPMDNKKLSIMKTQHTPGPWHVYRMGNYFGINSGSDSGMESTDRTIITFGDGDDDLCGVRGDTNEEMMANARLIAAAPELLEALSWSITFVKDLRYDEQKAKKEQILKLLKTLIVS